MLTLFLKLPREAENPRKYLTCGDCNGQGGIRTLGTLLTYTRFPIVLFRPLRHLPLHRWQRPEERAEHSVAAAPAKDKPFFENCCVPHTCAKRPPLPERRGRGSKRAPQDTQIIKPLWLKSDQPCGKRLHALLPIGLQSLSKRHEREESSIPRIPDASPARPDRALWLFPNVFALPRRLFALAARVFLR